MAVAQPFGLPRRYLKIIRHNFSLISLIKFTDYTDIKSVVSVDLICVICGEAL